MGLFRCNLISIVWTRGVDFSFLGSFTKEASVWKTSLKCNFNISELHRQNSKLFMLLCVSFKCSIWTSSKRWGVYALYATVKIIIRFIWISWTMQTDSTRIISLVGQIYCYPETMVLGCVVYALYACSPVRPSVIPGEHFTLFFPTDIFKTD